MCSVRAVLFDLDDTLLDRRATFELYVPKFATRYRDHLGEGAEADLRQVILDADACGYRGREEMAEVLRTRLPWRTVPAVADLVEGYRQEFLACAQASAGLDGVLRELRRRGIRTGIITNGQSVVQRRKVARLGLEPLMDAIVVSDEAGMKKPDPRIFRLALEKLGGIEPRHAWFVGDHPEFDVAGAAAVGMTAVWIERMQPWPEGRPRGRQVRDMYELLAMIDAA